MRGIIRTKNKKVERQKILINILNKTINASQKEIDVNIKEIEQIKDKITKIKVTNELTV